MPSLFDPTVFDLFNTLKGARKDATEKAAFTPSPAVAQMVMGGGGDPSQGGAPPGAGGPPPGAPAGPPPGAGGPPPGAGGPPPGDPAAAGGAPSPDVGGAPGGPQDPQAAKMDQILQLLQQGGGATGPGGKPATASLKIEPHHWHQLMHDISAQKAILTALAEKLGLEVPAAQVLNMQPPVPGPGGAAPGAPAPGGAAAGAPPSQVAQQLPSLPPVAAKSAADGSALVRRLTGGTPVSKAASSDSKTTFSKILSNLKR